MMFEDIFHTPLPTLSFDEFVENLQFHPANEAFENFSMHLFNPETAIFYIQQNQYFSRSFKKPIQF